MRLLLEDIGVAYRGFAAVRGVSMEIRRGEIVALLGPNGSGKSSLLRAAAGLQRHSGSVRQEGFLPQQTAFMPQDNGCRAALTVLETVLLGRLRSLGMRVPEGEVARAAAALARLGIAALAPRLLAEISGGQRQLVFLAQLLCAEPAALLLDEPTSALDLRNALELLRLLQRLAREQGLIVLLALHDLNAAAQFADRIAVMSEGRLVACDRPERILTPWLVYKVYGIEAEILRTSDGGRVIAPLAAKSRIELA